MHIFTYLILDADFENCTFRIIINKQWSFVLLNIKGKFKIVIFDRPIKYRRRVVHCRNTSISHFAS